ncbi:MAG: YgiT-type zinc finger protein [Candidatus Scalindua sp.]
MHKFGDCSFCGGEVKNDIVGLDYRYKEELYISQDVHAGVCQQCEEKISCWESIEGNRT